jgi:hypothetical protein
MEDPDIIYKRYTDDFIILAKTAQVKKCSKDSQTNINKIRFKRAS